MTRWHLLAITADRHLSFASYLIVDYLMVLDDVTHDVCSGSMTWTTNETAVLNHNSGATGR